MTTIILDSPRFDITATESLDYSGKPRYVVRYGLQCQTKPTLLAARRAFLQCLTHAMAAEGYYDPPRYNPERPAD